MGQQNLQNRIKIYLNLQIYKSEPEMTSLKIKSIQTFLRNCLI